MVIDKGSALIYEAFCLKIQSPISLPELPLVNKENSLIDIIVEVAELRDLWSELSEDDPYFVIQENLIMFNMPDVAIFLVEDGKRILFSPVDNAHDDHIRLYLLGTCMGAILMQRKILPLHGSALAINGKAYAIVGDSGAGKSTLASAFLKKGYRLLSDDVIPVSLNEENVPIVTPAYPQQKLWQESLNEFGMEKKQYRPIVDRETKFAIPVKDQFANEMMPLAGIFELVKTENGEIQIEPIQKLQRFHTLFYHTYRNFFIERSGLMEWHFHQSAKMLSHIELYQIQRPMSRFTANDLTELILATIHKEAKVV
ncbi:aldolase [Alkalihalobacterium alkalinitrilicum]|uniref:aldolase n=1 Tax=Alkalihalobacterium alkalinitrilicum TaxID=427920 RepID=UPI000995C32C|nr:aldolase [Alkalihalobacterium alkalinitrilicum]